MKIGLYALGALVAAFAVLGWAAPKDFKLERSIVIQKNLEPVFKYIRQIRHVPEWSAWLKKDPQAKIEFRGEDGKVGALLAWTSQDPEVGTGEQEFLNIADWEIVHSEIRIEKPFAVHFTSYLTVDGTGPQTTIVKMGMTDVLPFPSNVFSFIMNQVFGYRQKLSNQMDASLQNLKALLEAK